MQNKKKSLIANYDAKSFSGHELALRRLILGCLVAVTTVGLCAWLGAIVFGNGFILLDAVVIVTFSLKALWVVLVFYSTSIGFVLRRATVLHSLELRRPSAMAPNPILGRIAVVMPVRDENVDRFLACLRSTKASVDGTGCGDRFDYFLLSDSTRPELVSIEELKFEAWRATQHVASHLTYRRREHPAGLKGGNLQDFCMGPGQGYEFMVVLDADSIMAGTTIVQLARIMQANPRIGILQCTINCIFPQSTFARLFEFGHRLVWHNYILGSVWWQGERGQYRGHNAIVRIAAYAAHCRLSDLIGARAARVHVMCYDQVEGMLMHRAGYEVRELPNSEGSYEGLPPTLFEFLVRYQRWCQGNLTNLRLLWLPGLAMMDRYHLVGVAHRFLGWPAFTIFVACATLLAASWPGEVTFPTHSAALLYATFLTLYFLPRWLGLIDAVICGARRYGGNIRLALGSLIDLLFTLFFVPIAMVSTTWFLIQRLFGHRAAWVPQPRTTQALSWADAASALWPTTVFGIALFVFILMSAEAVLIWFLPFLAGLLLAVPFAMLTASVRANTCMKQWGLCAMPEEVTPPYELQYLERCEREFGLP
jgi:membrane glycosyltransferase